MKWRLLFLSAPLLLACPIFVGEVPANAAGDPTLNALIIPNPEPGWSPAPTREALGQAANLKKALQKEYAEPIVTAVKYWTSPTEPKGAESLLVGLVAFPNPPLSLRLENEVRSSALSFCKSADGKSPARNVPIASIPGGRMVTCFPTASGVVGVAAFYSRANVLTAVVSTAVNAAQLQPIASKQYETLPRDNFGTK